MPERTIDRIKREWCNLRKKYLQMRIKWMVHKLDELNYGAFMALSMSVDEHTTYHIIAGRFCANAHVYGTQVTYYNEEDRKKAESF